MFYLFGLAVQGRVFSNAALQSLQRTFPTATFLTKLAFADLEGWGAFSFLVWRCKGVFLATPPHSLNNVPFSLPHFEQN